MAAPTSRISGIDFWRTLEALSLYRAAACIALLALSASQYRPPYFEGPNSGIIDATLFIYFFTALILLILVRGEWPAPRWQPGLHIGVDISVIIWLNYFSGGSGNGLATLLVTPVAAGSLLLPGRLSSLPPAFATIALLLTELFLNLKVADYDEQFTATGMLGAGLFVIALAGSALAKRTRDSEAKARQAESHLEKLAALSQSVIQKMQAGVLTCSQSGHIELMNRAARNLLGSDVQAGANLQSCVPQLAQRLQHWLLDPAASMNSAIQLDDNKKAWTQFTRLGHGQQASILIVLDEASRVAEQAQSMKLASLGRLTASIAHELRNPLAAIQNAAELAAESPQLSEQDRRLLEIVQRQSNRLEATIRSVLNLSKKPTLADRPQALTALLDSALSDFKEGHQDNCPDVELDLPMEELHLLVDPVQFTQILHNLMQNSLTHAQRDSQSLHIQITAQRSKDGSEALIYYRDNGEGLPAKTAEHAFEPFFSTHHKHTGLGLFITRELCLAANGDLRLLQDDPNSGASFLISLPLEVLHP